MVVTFGLFTHLLSLIGFFQCYIELTQMKTIQAASLHLVFSCAKFIKSPLSRLPKPIQPSTLNLIKHIQQNVF